MKAISVHVEEDSYRRFKRLAAAEGRPVAELLREAMSFYLKRKKPSGKPLSEIPAHDTRVLDANWSRSEVFDEMIGD